MVVNYTLRHTREWADLAIALIIALFFVSIITMFTWGICCLWGFIGLIFVAIMVAVQNSHLRNTSKRVTKDDAMLHDLASKAAGKVGIDLPEIYVSKSNEVNAYTRGIVSPIIVLHQGILDRMDRKEISFILGHEMGHIRLRHYAITTILDSSGISVPLLIYLPLLAFRMLFLRGKLSRSMEYSADRAGLIACGDLESAVSTMIKLGSGKSVTPDQVKGAIDGRFQIDGDRGIMGAILSTHPDLDDRVKELVRFGRS